MENILFVCHWYPSKEQPHSGVFIKEHAKALKLNKVNLLVFHVDIKKGPSKVNVSRFIDKEGLDTLRLIVCSPFYKFIYKFSFFQKCLIRRCYKDIEAFNPSIIHSNVLFPSAFLGHYIANKFKLRHFITSHWSLASELLKKSLKARKVMESASLVFPVSKFLENEFKNHVSITSKVIPNIVDETVFTFKKKTHSNTIKFLAVANWNKAKRVVKRPDILFDSLNQVNKSIDKNIELELIGGGNMIPNLKRIATNLNFKVVFSGNQPKEYIAKALHKSDFLLHASNIETFSVVVAESLLTGTPVVASNVAAIPELVDLECGVLAENTINDWSLKIKQAINTTYNYEMIHERNKNKFSLSNIGKKIFSSYK